MKRAGWTVAAALVSLGGAWLVWRVWHREDPVTILQQALDANWHQADYEGVVEVHALAAGAPVQFRAHYICRYPNQFRMEYLSGPSRGCIVGSDGFVNWRTGTDGKVMTVTNRALDEGQSKRRFELMLKNYYVRCEGVRPVAGRRAHVIRVTPRKSFNPSHTYFIDRRKGIILGSESRTPDGRVYNAMQFVSIKFDPKLDDMLFLMPGEGPVATHQTAESAQPVTAEELKKRLGFAVRPPTYVPEGYILDGYYAYHCDDCKLHSAILRYIDGLHSISVFQAEDVSSGCATALSRELAQRRSLFRARLEEKLRSEFPTGHVVSLIRPDATYVVVGELDQRELDRMLTSLE